MSVITRTPVPLLDLQAQYATLREEIQAAVTRVLESQHFILGPEVKAFEEEIAAYSHVNHSVGVSSGTDAILLALMILDLKPGDEVITSAYSFFATAGSPARLGLKPVFVDIEADSYNLNPMLLEAAITPRTRVIIPVHLYGQMADMDPIMDIAARHRLTVIEDAAQAIGSQYRGHPAGSIGHMATFSFFPSKNLGGVGDGGMVTTQDDAVAERLQLFRNHGYQPKYHNKVVGGNFRLDAIQAAVLRVKLNYLEEWTAARQRNAETYRRLFAERGLVISAKQVAAGERGVMLPTLITERRHIYNQFVIRAYERDMLQAYLKERAIGTEVYYPVPLHLQECFRDLVYRVGDMPESEAAANHSLALPIYPELTSEQQAVVVDTIADFFAIP